jgi:hypothetical protein
MLHRPTRAAQRLMKLKKNQCAMFAALVADGIAQKVVALNR